MSRKVLTETDITNSKFKLDINNALGLDYEDVRSDLLALSLTKNSEYYRLRKELLSGITRNQTEEAYMTYWRILKNGQYKDEKGKLIQLKMDTVDFQPNLPDSIINDFSIKASRTILAIAKECVEEIMPSDFLALSQQRQKDLLVANGKVA